MKIKNIIKYPYVIVYRENQIWIQKKWAHATQWSPYDLGEKTHWSQEIEGSVLQPTFKAHSLGCLNFKKISFKFVLKDPIDNKSALVRVKLDVDHATGSGPFY